MAGLFGWDWCYFLILSVKTSFLFLIEHQSTYQRLIWSVWAIWIFPKRSYDFPRKRESTMKITASWCCLISLSCVLKLSRLRLFPQFLWYNKFPVIMDQVSGFSLVDINPNTTLKYKLFRNFNWNLNIIKDEIEQVYAFSLKQVILNISNDLNFFHLNHIFKMFFKIV